MYCFVKQQLFNRVLKNTAGYYSGPGAPFAADGATLESEFQMLRLFFSSPECTYYQSLGLHGPRWQRWE